MTHKPPSSSIHGEHLCLIDAQQQGVAQPWVEAYIHQLSSGTYHGEIATLSVDNIHIVHEQQNQTLHKFGFTPDNTCTISLALGAKEGMRFNHYRNYSQEFVFFLPQNHEADITVTPDSPTLYLCLPQDRLVEKLRILAPDEWERSPTDLIPFQSPNASFFSECLLQLLDDYSNHSLTAMSQEALSERLLECAALSLIGAEQWSHRHHSQEHAQRRSNALIRRVWDFVNQQILQGLLPTISEICCEVAVSQRTLQYAFRKELGVTPVAWLRIVRLNHVRASLLNANPNHSTVTDIATNWGFFHLSKFARDYSQMFCEKPSQTLRRVTPFRENRLEPLRMQQ